MRIIGGKFKGRRFSPPANKWPTRPTTDFAREALFNILQNEYHFENIKVLDLFGGTGSHTYEYLSRGCTDITYIDQYFPCIQFVKSTLKTLDVEEYVSIYNVDVFSYLENCKTTFDIIFADPPFDLGKAPTLPDIIFEKKLLSEEGLFILEHAPIHQFDKHPHFVKQKEYGGIVFSFFE